MKQFGWILMMVALAPVAAAQCGKYASVGQFLEDRWTFEKTLTYDQLAQDASGPSVQPDGTTRRVPFGDLHFKWVELTQTLRDGDKIHVARRDDGAAESRGS